MTEDVEGLGELRVLSAERLVGLVEVTTTGVEVQIAKGPLRVCTIDPALGKDVFTRRLGIA